MNAVDRELEAIVRREADSVSPPDGAMERGWARLMAELPGDDGGPGDGGGPGGAAPPAVRPVPLAKAVPLLKAVPLAALQVVDLPLLIAAARLRDSHGDGEQPGAQARSTLELREPARDHEECVMHRVLDIGRIDAEPPERAPHEVVVLTVDVRQARRAKPGLWSRGGRESHALGSPAPADPSHGLMGIGARFRP